MKVNYSEEAIRSCKKARNQWLIMLICSVALSIVLFIPAMLHHNAENYKEVFQICGCIATLPIMASVYGVTNTLCTHSTYKAMKNGKYLAEDELWW